MVDVKSLLSTILTQPTPGAYHCVAVLLTVNGIAAPCTVAVTLSVELI